MTMRAETHRKFCWITAVASFVLAFLGVMAGDDVAVVNLLMGLIAFAIGLTIGNAIQARRTGRQPPDNKEDFS